MKQTERQREKTRKKNIQWELVEEAKKAGQNQKKKKKTKQKKTRKEQEVGEPAFLLLRHEVVGVVFRQRFPRLLGAGPRLWHEREHSLEETERVK